MPQYSLISQLQNLKTMVILFIFKYENNKNLDTEEKFIFINAWNEWAEGTYLNPIKNMDMAI